MDYGPVSEEELLASADELFVTFDREDNLSLRKEKWSGPTIEIGAPDNGIQL